MDLRNIVVPRNSIEVDGSLHKPCSRCGEVKHLSEFSLNASKNKEGKDYLKSYCKLCACGYTTSWQEQNPEKYQKTLNEWKKNNLDRYYASIRKYQSRYPEKERARQATRNAINRGELNKPSSCSSCGERHQYIEGHHPDYSKPLDVTWLCKPCHIQVHKNLREGSNDSI